MVVALAREESEISLFSAHDSAVLPLRALVYLLQGPLFLKRIIYTRVSAKESIKRTEFAGAIKGTALMTLEDIETR